MYVKIQSAENGWVITNRLSTEDTTITVIEATESSDNANTVKMLEAVAEVTGYSYHKYDKDTIRHVLIPGRGYEGTLENAQIDSLIDTASDILSTLQSHVAHGGSFDECEAYDKDRIITVLKLITKEEL